MVLVIRTHDPQGRLTGTGLLLILGVRVHGRKHLGRWGLEQGSLHLQAPHSSLSIHPEPTSQRPQPREEKALAPPPPPRQRQEWGVSGLWYQILIHSCWVYHCSWAWELWV